MRIAWLLVRLVLAIALLGWLAHLLFLTRPQSNGVFYAVCKNQDCEVRLHLPRWPFRDPTVWRGPMFRQQLGQDPQDFQFAAPELAVILSNLRGYSEKKTASGGR